MNAEDCVRDAVMLCAEGEIDKAITKCNDAIGKNPFYAPAHWSNLFLNLLKGDYSRWADYDWYDDPRYFPKKGWFRRRLPVPLWNGEDLNGRRIFVYCDEGFGDLFQFLRYVELIQQKGGYTIVECLPGTEKIVRMCSGVNEIVSWKQTPICDTHCPLMLVPKYLNIHNHIHAPSPYLFTPTPNEHMKIYSQHAALSSKDLKIGVTWKGNPTHTNDAQRSLDAHHFDTLKTKQKMVSLQKGDYRDELFNVGVMLEDWNDTAQVISHLDIVISVDTAVAHLSAAMGKETWLLLPKIPDWRWGLKGTHTPWYPSMRIFRKNMCWKEIFSEMSKLLEIRQDAIYIA
jgi:hypothetical protein